MMHYPPLDMPGDEDVVEVYVQLGALPPEAALPRHVVRDQEEATLPVRLSRLQHQRRLLDLRRELLQRLYY